jgi:hypothetical protein
MIQMRQISFLLTAGGFVVGCGHCDREEKVLATGATGRSVVSQFEACTSFDWIDPAVIHISIGVVSSIAEKHDEVDGLHITYDIGTVISEACKG